MIVKINKLRTKLLLIIVVLNLIFLIFLVKNQKFFLWRLELFPNIARRQTPRQKQPHRIYVW